MLALVLGNSFCGIFLNVVQGFCLALIHEDLYLGALIIFTTSSTILGISAYAFYQFEKLPYIKYVYKKMDEEEKK